MNENAVILDVADDPARIARIKARERAAESRLADAHLEELLPQRGEAGGGRGTGGVHRRFGGEAKVQAAHPEDDGVVIRVIPLESQISPGMNPVTMEIETDPEELALSHAILQRAKLNSDWLQSHWADILPQARGEDRGRCGSGGVHRRHARGGMGEGSGRTRKMGVAISQYVPFARGPRIYADRRRMDGR